MRQDLMYAFRMAAKAPSFTAVAVLVLAVGIGANTAMFSFANELLLRPLWGRGAELVGVYSRDRMVPDSYQLFSYPTYTDIRANGAFESVMAQTYTMAASPAGDGTRRLLAAVVSSNYFETLGIRLAAGRPFTLDEERPGARVPVAIPTYAAWKKQNLDPAFIGSRLTVNSDEYTVIGVAPEGFSGTLALLSPEVFLPLGMFDAVVDNRYKNNGRGLGDRSNLGLSVAGRLASGVTMEGAAARLDVLSRQLAAAYPADNRNLELTTGVLSRLSLSTGPQSNTALATFTSFLLTLSGLVLVIACLNIANMLLARGAARRKEIAVRLALGAKRSRVIRQLLTESLLLAASGAALGLIFSYWAMRIFLSSLGTTLPFTLSLNPTPNMAVLAATVVFAAIGTIAFGLGPALGLSRRDLVSDLKDRSQAGAGSARRFTAKNVMVIAQVALSLALLTAGGIFTRTTATAAVGRPGYEYDGLLLARIDTKLAGLDSDQGAATYRELLTRARSQSGVTAVTLASSIPFGDSQDGRLFERVGGQTGVRPGSDEGQTGVKRGSDLGLTPGRARARAYRTIGTDYFASLGLRLLKGREFTAVEESAAIGPRVAIVDEALARGLFDGVDPIGQMIRVARDSGDVAGPAGEPMEIVGVAPPIREELLDHTPAGHVYVPFGRNFRSDMYIQARMAPGADLRAGLDHLRSTIREINPRVPVLASATMQAFHDDSLELWALRTASATFTALGVIALLIASIGVYGVRAYIVAQRTREIGIRMALGAGAGEVLKLVLKDGAFLTIAGLAIGLPLALIASVALRSVFVDVGGVDIIVIAIASIALAVAVTLAGAVPARRATKVEALAALRTE